MVIMAMIAFEGHHLPLVLILTCHFVSFMIRKCDNFTRQMLQSWRQALPAQNRCASARDAKQKTLRK